MSGHVFHPGHEALHGITVVLDATGDRTYVGRYDRRDSRGVHLLQVGVHQSGPDSETREDYLRQADEYGIRVDQPHLLVPEGEVLRITPLGEFPTR